MNLCLDSHDRKNLLQALANLLDDLNRVLSFAISSPSFLLVLVINSLDTPSLDWDTLPPLRDRD